MHCCNNMPQLVTVWRESVKFYGCSFIGFKLSYIMPITSQENLYSLLRLPKEAHWLLTTNWKAECGTLTNFLQLKTCGLLAIPSSKTWD